MRVRADEIKKGDKLPNGETVLLNEPADLTDEHRYIELVDGNAYIIPDWMEVEVERPEPTVTVTVTLPADVAERVAESWPDEWIDSADWNLRVMGLVGQAIRAELDKETER